MTQARIYVTGLVCCEDCRAGICPGHVGGVGCRHDDQPGVVFDEIPLMRLVNGRRVAVGSDPHQPNGFP